MTAVLERVEPAPPPPDPAPLAPRALVVELAGGAAPRTPRRLARQGPGAAGGPAHRAARRRGRGRHLLRRGVEARSRPRGSRTCSRSGPWPTRAITARCGQVDQSVDMRRSPTAPATARRPIGRASRLRSRRARASSSPAASAPVILEAGPWGTSSYVVVQDIREPSSAVCGGCWTVGSRVDHRGRPRPERGHAPARRRRADIATDDHDRSAAHRRTRLSSGSSSPTQRRSRRGPGVVLPGLLPASAEYADGQGLGPEVRLPRVLVASPRALTWSDVRALNAIGAAVVARGVLESPPSFCPIDVLCLDSGPLPQPEALPDSPNPEALANAARAAALAGVVLVLIVLQVALLAGPAFAVQLRRRQRELGLVGASGGTSADLRRAVLASGRGARRRRRTARHRPGLVGRAAARWSAARGRRSRPTAHPSGAAAALVRARRRGHRGRRCGRRVPRAGGARRSRRRGRRAARTSSAAGAAHPHARPRPPRGRRRHRARALRPLDADAIVLGLGVIAGELGLVLVMPWLVVQTGRLGRWAPLSSRMAVRDSGRHRLRTAAAACAIAAASASPRSRRRPGRRRTPTCRRRPTCLPARRRRGAGLHRPCGGRVVGRRGPRRARDGRHRVERRPGPPPPSLRGGRAGVRAGRRPRAGGSQPSAACRPDSSSSPACRARCCRTRPRGGRASVANAVGRREHGRRGGRARRPGRPRAAPRPAPGSRRRPCRARGRRRRGPPAERRRPDGAGVAPAVGDRRRRSADPVAGYRRPRGGGPHRGAAEPR